MRARRCAIWRPLSPASTSSFVVSVSIKVQLPALPLPKIVIRIPTTGILHGAGMDARFLRGRFTGLEHSAMWSITLARAGTGDGNDGISRGIYARQPEVHFEFGFWHSVGDRNFTSGLRPGS